jgi:hypothetical protein
MADYPKEITVKFKVYEDGKLEILGKEGTDLEEMLRDRPPIMGHNSIGVLVSNPTCFIVGGQTFCY